ncbi:MAG: ribosomal protein S18-alanine N-acetyltransferase [Clostridiales bacterium]|uniref:ribosomal protein S18-alanine N-acetyltransferase n=1 Tax=Clostridium sp. N3C TaxID=1776758 RepID=UPI00092E08C2|nr:ribosomal protein S18-alanine N-acetyltransferase [Clostridium sp. N3C]NLZ47251.1 ribosomal protein S18-alanine N-acetyltransferase [Clostridiales bacterium]SCN24968.1 Protease synthase and sporulation negative regulatory protein PAI 1 [Clostridium sp. N3C]
MSSIEIVPIEDKYIEGILNVSILSFPITWSKDSFEKELTNKYARYMVAVKDDLVVGFAGMWIILDEAHITNIAVHPEYRGFGIGTMLMESLISICKLENVIGITLEVRVSNQRAINLYKKFGFVEEGIRKAYYEDNKEDALIMWKRNF